MNTSTRLDNIRRQFKVWLDEIRRPVTTFYQRPTVQKLDAKVSSSRFGKIYACFGVAVLAISTIFWAILGARLNLQNADQLVNAYLFEKPSTFHDALLPGSHSFFLKWPLFWLIKLLGFSNTAYIWVTVLTVLLTVGTLAYVLYRIERRPLVIGTLYLALASILMLIPATPYAGALLPVNMAMLATRNIEYVVYILSLALLLRAKRIQSINFWAGIGLLAVLVASDKLFLSLTLGGAVLALTAYGLSTGWNLVGTAARWIVAGLIAAVGATAVLWLLNAWHFSHIVTGAGIGPYGIVHNAHDAALGAIYAVLHILTNVGSNPASQTILLHNVPHDGLHGLLSTAGFSYLVNFLAFCFAIYAAFQILQHSLAHNRDKEVWLSNPAKLSIALLWTSVAATAVFILSNHYYAADARYLTIVLFCLFVTTATYMSRNSWRAAQLVIIGGLCMVSILLAIPHVLNSYHAGQAALQPTQTRNSRVAAALSQHPVKVLVGDYWRVVPIKSAAKNKLSIMPLGSCTTPRDTLTSKAWLPDLQKNSFAYLLSFDSSLTDYPHCNLDQIIAAYGRPNASIIITGSVKNPTEILLFYDNGSHRSEPKTKLPVVSTVDPVELDDLPAVTCKQPTLMNIVAHEDDDLLFMNPDLAAAIHAGNCVRTIFITAGDAGINSFYWLGRERGSQAAYAKMLNFDDIWVERVVHISGDAYATVANPRGNNKVSLIYLHLPDGNMKGQGFSVHNNETLADLDSGHIPVIHEVYNNATYTAKQLTDALTNIMQLYQPTEIHTQANYLSGVYPDHSDHMAAGRFAKAAYSAYEAEHFAGKVVIPIKYYIGYPIHAMPINLTGPGLAEKEEVFSVYGRYDGGVCRSLELCRHDPAYGAYLPREYENSY